MTIRIGTRGSPLALAQAHMVAAALAASAATEIVVIATVGDQILDRPLSAVGGKGLFVKEIEAALAAGRVDCAVHSAKDLETTLPDELVIGAFLPREDVRDAFISAAGVPLAALPAGALVGTASLRRQALIRRARPDLRVDILRGNVQTRLGKLAAGACDATLLALAGLNRLGMAHVATELLDPAAFPPACAQGAIAVEVRANDVFMREACAGIDHAQTATAVAAERAFLGMLDGSCRTPIAGLATLTGDSLAFHGLVASPDGARIAEVYRTGAASDAPLIGADAGRELVDRVGPSLFAA